MATLTRDEITQALELLGKLAHSQGYTVELLVVGGSAMVLLYNARPATRDVDVVILSPRAQLVRRLAQQVAEAQDLPSDWLNDVAKGYVVGLSEGEIVFSAPGIVVKTPVPVQLLAMKLSAWRDDVDIADARQLLQSLTQDQNQVWQAITPYLVPGEELKAQHFWICGRHCMVQIETLAEAALAGDSLQLRNLVQDFFQESPCLSKIEKPDTANPQILATAAALLELFAERMHQAVPMWTKEIGPSPEPVYLLKSAATMKRLRQLCETAAPEPLRKRRLYAPPNYLEFV